MTTFDQKFLEHTLAALDRIANPAPKPYRGPEGQTQNGDEWQRLANLREAGQCDLFGEKKQS